MSSNRNIPAELGDDAEYGEPIVLNKKTSKLTQIFRPDPELIEQLVEMGFEKANADTALTHTKNNLEWAIELLSNGGIAPPPQPRQTSQSTEVEPRSSVPHQDGDAQQQPPANPTEEITPQLIEARIYYLVQMGFTREQSEVALAACNNDMNEALNMLLSQSQS